MVQTQRFVAVVPSLCLPHFSVVRARPSSLEPLTRDPDSTASGQCHAAADSRVLPPILYVQRTYTGTDWTLLTPYMRRSLVHRLHKPDFTMAARKIGPHMSAHATANLPCGFHESGARCNPAIPHSTCAHRMLYFVCCISARAGAFTDDVVRTRLARGVRHPFDVCKSRGVIARSSPSSTESYRIRQMSRQADPVGGAASFASDHANVSDPNVCSEVSRLTWQQEILDCKALMGVSGKPGTGLFAHILSVCLDVCVHLHKQVLEHMDEELHPTSDDTRELRYLEAGINVSASLPFLSFFLSFGLLVQQTMAETGLTTRSRARRKRTTTSELDGINNDIQDVINSNPAAAGYFIKLPAKKKQKNTNTKTRQAATRKATTRRKKTTTAAELVADVDDEITIVKTRNRAPSVPVAGPSTHDPIDIDDSESDDDTTLFPDALLPLNPISAEDPAASRPSKAQKKLYPAPSPSVSDRSDRKCAVYVYVSKPAPKPIGRAKSAPHPVAERGPFFFPLTATFPEFCTSLAKTVGCQSTALHLPSIKWKFTKPDKDPLKALSNDDGFEAMVISIDERSKDLNIAIHLPPPLITAIDLPYETDDYKPPDSFDELDAPVPTSVHSQMATLDTSSAPIMEALRVRYPFGNNPLFPGKRIVTSKQFPDRHWELNDIRTRVWASHILGNKATYEEPPKSAHFSEEQRIRPPLDSRKSTAYCTCCSRCSVTHCTDSNPNLAPPSPAVRLPRQVTLQEFCVRYNIPTTDEPKLAELEWTPGDRNLERLDESDWKDVGFKRLGWLRVLDTHKVFLSDVRGGAFT
ncbi:hypothetical protein C8R43DRAFT_1126890 [Mycena crocata]|nr:hypothetical protein C8R43DRAFT_1126890 [Mycena crocata]